MNSIMSSIGASFWNNGVGGYSSKAAVSFVRKVFPHYCFCKSNDGQYNKIIGCSMVAHNKSNKFRT